MAGTTDDDIYSDRTRNERVYGILNLYTACINFLQRQFFSFLVLTIKQNTQKKITSMNQIVQRTQYEINGNLDY